MSIEPTTADLPQGQLGQGELAQGELFVSKPRIAAIDIGSNSVRVVVAQVTSSGYRVLDEERENTRLASAITATGKLDDGAMEATLIALRGFLKVAEGYGVEQIRAIATSAVRDATNGVAFCERIRTELGLNVEIITAQEEARLAFMSVARAFDVTNRQVAVADIGGGSTEVILASGGHIDEVYATRLGAVRVAEKCQLTDVCSLEKLEAAAKYVDQELKKSIKKPPFTPALLFGSGGTFTALAAILLAREGQPGESLWGYRVTHAEVHHLVQDLGKLSLEKRAKVPGLNPKRADIIVAGLVVIEALMRRLKVNTVQVHTRGVRDGVLLTMVEDRKPASVISPAERRAAVELFAQSCGVEFPHARQVAWLAGKLLEELAEPLGMDVADRELIESAAILANCGYLINFDQHHKHSYRLIVNSELPGFERQDLRILANVARYHRGSPPKAKHEGYAALPPRDQQRVGKLAALVRLALALDRTQQQQVRDLKCEVFPERVEITIAATGNAEVDLWAARRKVELFDKVFRRQCVFVAPSPD